MLRQLAVNVFLAFAWMLLTDHITGTSFVTGYLLGGIALWFFKKARHQPFYGRKVFAAVKLVIYFIWQQIVANLQIALIVLSPRLVIDPAIVKIPLTVTNELQATLVSSLITLTPGTLSIDFTKDHQHLFVHIIDASGMDGLIQVTRTFERYVQEAVG